MDIASSSRSLSSLPFSDQSHALFYSRPVFPRHRPLFRSPSSRSSVFPETAPSDSQPSLRQQEAALLQEFADLKLRLKHRKKELKALDKQAKKAAKKPKTVKAKKMAKDRDSSSSSSSESSDDEERSMKTLTKGLGLGFARWNAEAGLGQVETATAMLPMPGGVDANVVVEVSGAIAEASIPSVCTSKRIGMTGGKIQVCVGGKCRKAGSEQLMASLRERIPSNCGVEAVPCKCMGKCAMAINVKVQKDETNPQLHCHAGPQDANHILSHHFGIGALPCSVLPSFAAAGASSSIPASIRVLP